MGLANLPHRKAKNPAGTFIRELQAGDFAPVPKVQQHQRQAGKAEALQRLVVDSEEAERFRSVRIQEAIDRLDESRRAALLDEARRAIARITGRPLDQVDPAAPWVVCALENIVEQQMQSGIL